MCLGAGRECSSHKNVFCKTRGPKHKPKMVFVQWYMILDENKLSVDKLDKTLRCIYKKRQQTKGTAGKLFFL